MTQAVNSPAVPDTAGARKGKIQGKVLSVDWTACDGRGLCTDLLPELLEPDPWGFPRSRPGSAAGPGALTVVPAGLTGPARQAVRLCPKLALRLTE